MPVRKHLTPRLNRKSIAANAHPIREQDTRAAAPVGGCTFVSFEEEVAPGGDGLLARISVLPSGVECRLNGGWRCGYPLLAMNDDLCDKRLDPAELLCSRRQFLSRCGLGLGALGLASLLTEDVLAAGAGTADPALSTSAGGHR